MSEAYRQGWRGVIDELRPSMFSVQILVSATVMFFSIAQLAKGEPTDIYLPVLTGVMGYWLPAPRSKTTEAKAIEKVGAEFNRIAASQPAPFGSPIAAPRQEVQVASTVEVPVANVV